MSPAGAVGTSRIAGAFEPLRAKNRLALMPFLAAGFPDLETTQASIQAIEQSGATLVEVGIPFSDPIADGPVIQAAFAEALARRIRLSDIFRAIRDVRSSVSIPLVSMVSYSIVYRYGLERFLTEAREAGFDGLILPDLPPPEAQGICDRVWAAGLDTTLLVAPTTTPARRQDITNLCSGFVYYLSVSGTTGERKELPSDLVDNLRQLRQVTQKPVCVGFGISTPQHVAQLKGHADGAIVGSGVVRRMSQHKGEGSRVIADAVGTYCRELLSGA